MRKFTAITGAAALAIFTTACSGGEDALPSQETASQKTESQDSSGDTASGATTSNDETAAAIESVAFSSLTGDAAAGEKAFAQCKSCHSADEGVNKIGPSLAGVVGRKAGSVADYSYSEANINSGLTWTEEQLYDYLEDPQRVVPKTKMIFPGIKDSQKRADVIAYLNSLP